MLLQVTSMSHKRSNVFFPGRVSVQFCKGSSGFLLQSPSDAAAILKNNPSLQDKSLPEGREVPRETPVMLLEEPLISIGTFSHYMQYIDAVINHI